MNTNFLRSGLLHGLRWSGLMPALRWMFAGRAVIIMFHEIQRDHRFELMTGTPVSLFEYSLSWLTQQGWQIVGLETCLERLVEGDFSRRYAVLTFDDGYRDNVSVALPILERHHAPFMVYIPTGAPTRTLLAWWLGLRELIRSRDEVSIDAMGTRIHCPDLWSKVSALKRVTAWVHDDYRRSAMLEPTFKSLGVSLAALADAYFLDEREIRALGRHPLASIGGHTTSHAALKTLEAAEAHAEMAGNRAFLEGLIGRPIRHLAYPYGGPKACGPREEHLAKQAGFSTAVTTRHGQLHDRHPNHCALPRIGVGEFDTRISFEAKMNGLQRPLDMLKGQYGAE
jgi:peptidoglycan/xylan/chitin deacetylase (PgdA/CDA1 family)